MLALLLVRLAAFGTRLALEGWAGAPALRHYFAMEVRCACWACWDHIEAWCLLMEVRACVAYQAAQ